MSLEIERKFLVTGTGFLAGVPGERLVQGYLAATPQATVRVRIGGERAWLTLKGATTGYARREFEYEIPVADAELCLAELCAGPVLAKRRYRVPAGVHTWEVDVFEGENDGLVVAEIELGHPDEAFERPPWLGREVSDDPRYFNSQLAANPWSRWREPPP